MFQLTRRVRKSVGSLGKQLSKCQNAFNNTPRIRQYSQALAVPNSLSKSMYDDNEEIVQATKYLHSVYPEVMGQIEKLSQYKEVKEILVRLREAIDYTVPHGKKFRGAHIVSHFKLVADPKDLTPENVKLSAVLGWCAEIIQAYFCMLDDIMDDSDTRRGKPTWYKLPGIGLNAITDVSLMEVFTFELLQLYFSNHPSFETIQKIFRKVLLYTHLGQGYDYIFLDPKTRQINFNAFTESNYETLCRYKLVYPTMHSTIELTCALANIFDQKKIDQVDPVLMKIGVFHQVQNDFKDLFRNQGDVLKQIEHSVLGTDILSGQMTWFVQKALAIGNEEQKKIIKENYGKNDMERAEAVRQVYEELNIKKLFMDYEEESFQWLRREIPKINNGLPQKIFNDYTYAEFKRRPEA